MKRINGIDEVGDACLAVAEQLEGQPELFGPGQAPMDIPVLKGARVFARTGRISAHDEAKALAVAACKLAGLSDREASRRTGVTASTVPAIMRALEASGRIPSVHHRLTQSLSSLAESSASEMQRMITNADGEWTPASANAVRSLAIAMGVAIDKGQLLTGHATQIVEQRSGPSADQVAEWEQRLRTAFGTVLEATPDPQSAPIPQICGDSSPISSPAPDLATELPPPDPIPTHPSPLKYVQRGGQAGGGIAQSATGATGDGFVQTTYE